MSKLLIQGGKKLSGSFDVPAAKNAYLPILAASILSEEKVVLHNYPGFADTENMCNILSSIGVKIERQDDCLIVDPSSLFSWSIESELASQVRSSIFMLGALLAKERKAKVAYPGGCEIGVRPIDIHLSGFRKMGVKVEEKHGYIYCDALDIHSAFLTLDFPSVGATESLMMAACL